MHLSSPLFAGLTLLLAPLTTALDGWEPHKAAQLNFYTSSSCSTRVSDLQRSLWNPDTGLHPTIRHTFDRAAAVGTDECKDFSISGIAWAGIRLDHCWYETSSSPMTIPIGVPGSQGQSGCWCELYDGFGCTGTSVRADQGCQNGRSSRGLQWKSAKCYQHN